MNPHITDQIILLEGQRSKLRRNRRQLLAEMDHLASEEIRITEQILNLQLSCPPTLAPSATSATPTNS